MMRSVKGEQNNGAACQVWSGLFDPFLTLRVQGGKKGT